MKLALLIVAFVVLMTESAFLPPAKGNLKIMHDGPKVAIKSFSLNTRQRTKSGSDLHEIYVAPYRFVSIVQLQPHIAFS
jgi:hypothetical protein